MMQTKKKVSIIGSGNWGSALAKLIGDNTVRLPNFHDEVSMYVYEELIEGRKLTEIINETHENVKYLPGHKLPSNVIAVPDVVEAAREADFIVFTVPHQFIRTICSALLGKIKPTAVGLSLIKGFDQGEGGGIELISHIIYRHLKIQVCVLMGAFVANEIADEKFGEVTIGCREKRLGPVLKELLETDYFKVVVVDDVDNVEVCGALSYVVACGVGILLGLGYGENTKAAVFRLGFIEMVKFVDNFYPGSKLVSFFESCGVSDLAIHCSVGRTLRLMDIFVKSGKTIKEIEDEVLNGQTMQGPYTAAEVYNLIKSRNMEDRFPIFTSIHKICIGDRTPETLITSMQNHPDLSVGLRWKTLIA